MTLDEARAILEVARGASHADIRDAFRRRARLVHPDAHPTASAAQRTDFARQFDRARQARDILLLLPERTAAPAPDTRDPTAPTASTGPTAPAGPAVSPPPAPPPWRPPRDPATSPAPQRTLRFDEFVQVVDAAGFGAGHRSKPSRSLGRVLLWTTVGALSAGVLVSVVWTAIAM